MIRTARSMLLRRLGRQAAWRRSPDLADMGTALALDAALVGGTPTALLPDDDLPPPARPAASVSPWRRLWPGRKVGA